MQKLAQRASLNHLLASSLVVRVARLPAGRCVAKSQPRKRQRPKPIVRKPRRDLLTNNVSFGDDVASILLGLVEEARAPKVIQLDDSIQLPDDALVGTSTINGAYAVRSHDVIRDVLVSPSPAPKPPAHTDQPQPDPPHETSLAVTATSAITSTSSIPTGEALIRSVRGPSHLDFHEMYTQLAAWTAKYTVSHVPRKCFDAPVLGTWVWWLRQAKKRGRLLQWQIDLVSKLDFAWVIDEQDAKWFNDYHHLRRYKMVHGTAHVPEDFKDRTDEDFNRVGGWLKRQAKMYAKDKLSAHKIRMLELLGVELRVDEARVQKHAQLQGLNAMERRQVRRMWKREDDKKREVRAKERAEEQAVAALEDRRKVDEERLQQFKGLLRERQQGVRYIGGLAVKVKE